MFRKFLTSTTVTRLGRWGKGNARIKADLANHDHCGSNICQTVPRKIPKSDCHDSSMDVAVAAMQSFHVYPSKSNPKISK